VISSAPYLNNIVLEIALITRASALALVFCVLLSPAASFAAPTDLGTVSLGWFPGPDTPQVAQAVDKGLWTKRSLGVKMVSTPTGREALEALVGGQCDYALMAELPPVIGALQHQNFRIIATLARYVGTRVIATRAIDANFKNLAGLKIGTTLGTNVAFQTARTLQTAGVTATIVNLAPSDLTPALVRGDIDAAFMFGGFYPQAKKVLGEKYFERRTPWYKQTFVLVASTEELTKHPDRVKAMLAGLLEANELILTKPAESAAVTSKAMGGLTPPDGLLAQWSEYTFSIVLDRPLIELLNQEASWVHENGSIKGPAPSPALFETYIDAAPLAGLERKNVQLK
jgi:ABC-type nitrate/sulfonate/bicarbonate transport system substrate-binding protein